MKPNISGVGASLVAAVIFSAAALVSPTPSKAAQTLNGWGDPHCDRGGPDAWYFKGHCYIVHFDAGQCGALGGAELPSHFCGFPGGPAAETDDTAASPPASPAPSQTRRPALRYVPPQSYYQPRQSYVLSPPGQGTQAAAPPPRQPTTSTIPLSCVQIRSLSTNMSTADGQFWNNFPQPTNALGCPSSFTLHYRDPSQPNTEATTMVWPGNKDAFVTQAGAAQPLWLSE